ncbi:MAG: hypothetical protein Altm2KO_16080 [Alteromonas macleodii]
MPGIFIFTNPLIAIHTKNKKKGKNFLSVKTGVGITNKPRQATLILPSALMEKPAIKGG